MRKSLIKTLTINQLLKRTGWENETVQNILEIADEGAFGVYIQPRRKKIRTWHDVSHYVEKLSGADYPVNVEKRFFKILKKKLREFRAENPHLLTKPKGFEKFERLPTSIETEIYPLVGTSSIQCLLDCGKIFFSEYNNTFGFFEDKGKIIANSHFLLYQNQYFPPPKDYKGFYSVEDVFLFVDQIKRFELKERNLNKRDEQFVGDEKSNELINAICNKKRPNELHKVIISAYKGVRLELQRDPSAREVWSVVMDVKYDTKELIEVQKGEEIIWKDTLEEERFMSFGRFSNFITDYRNGKYFDA